MAVPKELQADADAILAKRHDPGADFRGTLFGKLEHPFLRYDL